MALIMCKECSNQISDTAISCPKCGYVKIKKNANQKISRGNVLWKIIFVLIASFVLLIFVIAPLFESKEHKEARERLERASNEMKEITRNIDDCEIVGWSSDRCKFKK